MRALAPVLAVVVVAGGVLQARADPAPAAVVNQTPPTTAPNLLEELLKGLNPTTTTVPPPVAPTDPGAPSPDGGAPSADGPVSPGDPPPDVPQSISPDMQAMIDSVQRSGGRTTLPLMDQLRLLRDVGFTDEEAGLLGMGHFPIAGEATWRDDFYDYRAGPPVHLHQGTDIFANRGTPIRAPVDGRVSFSEGGLGGKMFNLNGTDGNTYFGAHLDAFGEVTGSVKQGDVIGTVGDTGNAVGGSPHLHFEIRPGGGAAINPKPILDGWVDEAVAAVPAILASFRVGIPRALTDAGLLRRYDPPITASSSATTNVVWASSMGPGGVELSPETLRAAQAAGKLNGEQVAALQQALNDAWIQARQLSRAVLSPITPPALSPILLGRPA